ncbi:MAG TPA: hypothetical protein VK622_08065 [Puia sp.]|nr:hypothetical protein [Puia sp.]
MQKIRYSFLLTISLFEFFSSRAQSNLKLDTAAKHYYGSYVAYKWVNEDVTEMTSSEADSWLKEGMSIRRDRFYLFTDTLRQPWYEKRREDTEHFLNHYTVRENGQMLSKLPGDSVTYLAVIKENGIDDHRIIITPTDLIVNYKGCFYFFKRSRNAPAAGKRS